MGRRSIAPSRRLLAGAGVALSALVLTPAGAAAGPAQELVDRYAPIVALKEQEGECGTTFATGEPWRPTSVQIVLGNPEVMLRGPGAGSPVVTTAPTAADLYRKGDGYFLDFPGNPLSPGCAYEVDGKAFAEGTPSLAYAHIATEEGVPGKLALEYWLYYYFNDFNNKHESDWEGIQLVFDADTVEEALLTEPVEVGYAQHEGGERADWNDEKLEKVGDHPVVYPAAGSHASYFSDQLWLGRAASEGIGCDDSTGPSHQIQLAAVVVPTEPASSDGNLAWLAYDGLWGEKEKAPNNGPTGPNTKDRWQEPITWQNGLRGGSVAVPAGRTFGPSVSSAFCGGVEFAAGLFTDYLDEPVVTIALIVVVLGLLLASCLADALAAGTGRADPPAARWRTDPSLGRTDLRAPPAPPPGARLNLPLARSRRSRPSVAGDHARPDVELDVSLTALSTILATPAVALVLRNLDSGRRLGCVQAYRCVLRRFWSLLGAAAIAVFVQLAIAITLVGIPVAVYRLVRRIFVLFEVVLRGFGAVLPGRLGGTRGRELVANGAPRRLALRDPDRSRARRRLRASLRDGILARVIDAIGSVIYMVVFPYAAIAATLLYFDLLERRRDAEAPA